MRNYKITLFILQNFFFCSWGISGVETLDKRVISVFHEFFYKFKKKKNEKNQKN